VLLSSRSKGSILGGPYVVIRVSLVAGLSTCQCGCNQISQASRFGGVYIPVYSSIYSTHLVRCVDGLDGTMIFDSTHISATTSCCSQAVFEEYPDAFGVERVE